MSVPLAGFFLEDTGDIGIGVAGVDHQRQSGLAGGRGVGAEALFLCFGRAVLVEIIEPRLADRHDFRMGRDCHEFGHADVRFFGRVVRMRAHGAEHVIETLGDGANLRETMHARADRHHAPNPSLAGAFDDCVGFLGKL